MVTRIVVVEVNGEEYEVEIAEGLAGSADYTTSSSTKSAINPYVINASPEIT